MSTNNRKAAPNDCSIEDGSGEQISLPDVRISDIDFTTAWSGKQGVAQLLLHGEENAIPLRHLEKMTGWDQRTTRQRIQEERLKGVPILATNQTGYYLPANSEEMKRCVSSMLHRAAEIEKSARAIELAEVI